MKQHLDLMKNILKHGDVKGDRTGTGTISLFGGMMKFSLQHGMWPIPTTREVNHEQISSELEWMLKGIISVQWLKDHKNPIWNSWMGPETGTIGPMYGEQWRNYGAAIRDIGGEDEKRLLEILAEDKEYATKEGFSFTVGVALEAMKKFVKEKTKLFQDGGRGGVDQLQYVINELLNNPDSRRILVNVWHAGLLPDLAHSPKENADLGNMALAPCHSTWQVATAEMSDLEILRQCAYKHPVYEMEIQQQLASMAHLASTDMAKKIALLANVWLCNQGLVKSNIEIPMMYTADKAANWPVDITCDSTFDLTDSGRTMIEKYKEKGLPIRKLSLLCFARSQDVPLGTVYNVGMYSLLAHQLASMANMVPWEYTHLMGDHHIYSNQVECVNKQLARTPMKPCQVLVDPSLEKIEDFNHKNLTVYYTCDEKIVFPRAAV